MSETREIRVYMLAVGIVAAAMRIGMVCWFTLNLERSQCVREIVSFVASRSARFWSS